MRVKIARDDWECYELNGSQVVGEIELTEDEVLFINTIQELWHTMQEVLHKKFQSSEEPRE